MRIGDFAAQSGVTADTLRHYMDLGLLVVEKRGGQYDFDDRAAGDLERVLSLKNMGFSLAEIKQILFFERLGKMTDYQKDVYYQGLFSARKNLIERDLEQKQRELEALTEAEEALKRSCMELSKTPRQVVGVPLEALEILMCLRCGEGISLREGEVQGGKIMSGCLACSGACGFEIRVAGGILYSGSSIEATEDHLQLDQAFLETYLKSTDPSFLDRVYEGLHWIEKRTDFKGYHRALELGSGHGFYLRTIYDQLTESLLYVAVDYDPSRHHFLKTMLEAAARPGKILLLCAPFEALPLKPDSFDCLLDFTGTSNYSFDHSDFLLSRIHPLVKAQAKLYGSFIVFDRFGVKTRIPEPMRANFTEAALRNRIEHLGFRLTQTYTTQSVNQGGVYEDYFNDDEVVRTFICIGER
jgi:DNA-binding transcriptional MerR regulator